VNSVGAWKFCGTSGRGTVLNAEVGRGAAVFVVRLALVLADRTGPSFRAPPLRQGWRFARGSKRRELVSFFRLATAWEGAHAGLYGAYLSMEGTLGAADCVLLRGGMPEAALVGHACVFRLGWARAMYSLVGCNGWKALQPAITTSLRQKVSELIGLGLSLRFERSRWRECVWHCRGTPLARDLSVGPSRKGRCHPPKQRSVYGSHRKRRARGSSVPAVVVVDRVGCRS